MVGGDGVGDLFENRRLAGAWRRDDQPARAPADGRDHVNDARFEQLGSGFEPVFINRVDRGEVLKRTALVYSSKVMPLTSSTVFNCGLVPRSAAALGPADNVRALAQENCA